MAKTPHSQFRGPGSDPRSRKQIHTLQLKVLHATTKDPTHTAKAWHGQIHTHTCIHVCIYVYFKNEETAPFI